MARIDDIGERDDWRCWLCDEAVDPTMSVNDDRGPSVDACITKAKAKSAGPAQERLAHRGCNTKKGAITAVIPWPDTLFVSDPVVILSMVDRLQRKGGREVAGRCVNKADAHQAATWLTERIGRLRPELKTTTAVEATGGQFLLVVQSR